ncbi:YfhO family protein [Enterococcus sp. LJL99]
MKIKFWNKGKFIGFFLSLLVPVIIMIGIYYSIGIYPGSEKTILASDAFAQTAPFFASFNNVLHGKQNILYSWNASLGLNYWSLMAYYINGIFSVCIAFFSNKQIPDALYMILLLKFGAMSTTFWIMGNNIYKLPQKIIVCLSISYSLSGFCIAYSLQQMWLDGLIFLPLIILGIHRLMDENKLTILFIFYFLLFISNFYIAFMVGLFSFLYYICRLLTDVQLYKQSILNYLITSFLAGGASMIVILPTVLDLMNNGESLNEATNFFTRNLGFWDIPVKTMVGAYDTSKYGSAPFIYFGLFATIFCIFYFVSPKITLKNKLIYGGLVIVLIASVYIEPLNLFWHGFHSPYMFLFRFSFLLSFLGLLLAGYGLEKYEDSDFNRLVNYIIGLALTYIVIVIVSNKKRYFYINKLSILLTLIILLIYCLLLLLKGQKKVKPIVTSLLFMFLFTSEMTLNAKLLVDAISREWSYTPRKAYTENYDEITSLVDWARYENKHFYRLENIDKSGRNDSFVYGYNGVSMFSSIRNRHSSQYLDKLGFRSQGTNLTIQYNNNTLVMDSILGIKYNLAKKNPHKFGFEEVKTNKNYKLFENKYALPLGMLTDKGIYEKDVVNNQTELVQYLSKESMQLFSYAEAKMTKKENVIIEDNDTVLSYSKETPGKYRKMTYEIAVPENSQAYLSLYGQGVVDIKTITKQCNSIGNLEASGQYYNLGYYEKAQKIKVEVLLLGEDVVNLVKPTAMFLNVNNFKSTIDQIKKNEVFIETNGRKATANVNLTNEQVLFTTIPYDKGWSIYVDGNKVDTPVFKDAFLTVPLSKGKHTIKFVFLPQGFKIGCSLFLICIIGFVFYSHRSKKTFNQKRSII